MLGPFSKLRTKIPANFPGSLAAQYVNESAFICGNVNGAGFGPAGVTKRQQCYDDKVAVLDKILKQSCPAIDNFTTGIFMHIRLGDAFCVTTDYVLSSLKPPTVSEVARVRGRRSERVVNPLSLEGEDCRGVQFARVPLQNGEKPRLRPRRSDRMAAVLAAKAARDRMLARRLGQAEGHKEAEGRAYFKATHNPPGQPSLDLPREMLIRSREKAVWARQHPDVMRQRKAWEAKDKLLFEKNRLRKMITDKLTQENNDKKVATNVTVR